MSDHRRVDRSDLVPFLKKHEIPLTALERHVIVVGGAGEIQTELQRRYRGDDTVRISAIRESFDIGIRTGSAACTTLVLDCRGTQPDVTKLLPILAAFTPKHCAGIVLISDSSPEIPALKVPYKAVSALENGLGEAVESFIGIVDRAVPQLHRGSSRRNGSVNGSQHPTDTVEA